MKCIKCGADLLDGSIFCHICGKKQIREQRKALKRANGTGSVSKLSGRRRRPWIARKNGIVIGYYESKTEALDALSGLTGKNITDKYNMTFSEVYDAWSKEHFRGLSQSSINGYKNAYAIMTDFHNVKFRNLRTSDFQAFIDSKYADGRKRSTLSKYTILFSLLSQWAAREEIITTNFAQYILLPKETKAEKQIFTDEDIEKLSKDNSETAKIILMLIYTGMRIGELFNLSVDDYYGDYCIGGEKTEAGRNRIIPIRPEGRDYFKYFADIATDKLLLSGYDGNRDIPNFRKRNYYPLLDKLGIEKKTPHCTRHTFASWAVSVNIKPELLQKMLGHANYSTTANIYVHSEVRELVAAVNFAAGQSQAKSLI